MLPVSSALSDIRKPIICLSCLFRRSDIYNSRFTLRIYINKKLGFFPLLVGWDRRLTCFKRFNPILSTNTAFLHSSPKTKKASLSSRMKLEKIGTHQGELGSLRWCVLTQQRPVCILAATRWALDKSVVQIPAPNPYLLEFANAIPSASSYSTLKR